MQLSSVVSQRLLKLLTKNLETMKTHVIYENGLYTENYNPTIEILPCDWDFSFGNFTGTKEDCKIEAKKMILEHTAMLNERNSCNDLNTQDIAKMQDAYADELTLNGC